MRERLARVESHVRGIEALCVLLGSVVVALLLVVWRMAGALDRLVELLD